MGVCVFGGRQILCGHTWVGGQAVGGQNADIHRWVVKKTLK